MASTYQSDSNFQRLQKAGIVNQKHEFTAADQQIIARLSAAEVDSLIAIADKLGQDFLLKHGGGPTAGILF